MLSFNSDFEMLGHSSLEEEPTIGRACFCRPETFAKLPQANFSMDL